MIETESDSRRTALADFLTRSRKALPAPAGGRRRTAGLRREEVATAAGVSATWYTWLEQGRDIRMSQEALSRLGRALCLDMTLTRYLFELARPVPVPVPPLSGADRELRLFLDGLSPLPAYALDRAWTIVAANSAARRVLGLGAKPESLIEKLFLDPAWRVLFQEWETVSASSVAQYRAVVGARPEYRAQVERLSALSADFARLWAAGEVRGAPLWRKVLRHPDLGRLTMRYASLGFDEAAGMSLSIYTPADDATRQALGAI